jgi:hypothetical protein
MLSVENSTHEVGKHRPGSDVLGHMLLIPSLIFVAVIELASRIADRRSLG